LSNLCYPPDFDRDYHAEWHEARRRRALKALEPGDVIATVEDTLAGEPDPHQHPLYHLVCYILEYGPQTGTRYWARESLAEAWEQRIQHAIEALVDEALARGED
jgi:hypothetical protein